MRFKRLYFERFEKLVISQSNFFCNSFPSRARLIFALFVLIRPRYTIIRVMANSHGFSCCFFKLILLVLLIRSTKKLPSDDESTNTALPESEFTSYRHFSEAVQTRVAFGLTTRWRHVGSLSKVVGYYGARISRYANSDSTFQLIRVVISGDVSENPGPTVNKP